MTDQKRILVVEDEPDLCEMLFFEFQMKGFPVYQAKNGIDALEKIEVYKPDVVVTDIRMEEMNGLELLERLKKENVFSPVVILVSAFSDINPAEGYRRSAEAVFTKPFSLHALVESVYRLTSPLEERWKNRPADVPWYRVTIAAADLEEGRRTRIIDLGRGGMCFQSTEFHLAHGDHVAVCADWESSELSRLEAIGLIRWRARFEGDGDAQGYFYGVEFEYISEETLAPFLAWLQTVQPVPYIPAFEVLEGFPEI